ncbi:MAG: hypothetical protein D3922_11280 [Candidatus Electrothrix sp. AR1]|nr:hypothetical protein [Candidatus Electrothrix sp. AR1]
MPKIDWDGMTDLFKCNRAFEEVDKLTPALSRGVGGPVSSLEMDMIKREASRIEDKFLRQSSLHDFPTREKVMGLQLDSKEYNDFLRLINDLAEERDLVRDENYYLFCKNDPTRQQRILSAICRGKIKFQIKKGEGQFLECGALEIYDDFKDDDDFKEFISFCLDGGSTDSLLLEPKSFLSWLKKEYPYEGEEQAKAEPKENQFYMSDELELAIDCSRELYSTKPPEASTLGEKKTNAQAENKKINEWMQRNGVEVKRKCDRIRVMVNPYTD